MLRAITSIVHTNSGASLQDKRERARVIHTAPNTYYNKMIVCVLRKSVDASIDDNLETLLAFLFVFGSYLLTVEDR